MKEEPTEKICEDCDGTGEGMDTYTSEYTPACKYCGGKGLVPIKNEKETS